MAPWEKQVSDDMASALDVAINPLLICEVGLRDDFTETEYYSSILTSFTFGPTAEQGQDHPLSHCK